MEMTLPQPPVLPTPGPAEGAPLELLRRTSFCRGLADADLAALAELMRLKTYQPGEFVFRQGTPPDGLYILESGECLFWTRIGDARQDIVRFTPGQALCHSALFETSGRLASCEATLGSRVWLLDLHAYQGLRGRRHEAVFQLAASSATHLGKAFATSMGWLREALGVTAVAPQAAADALPPAAPITDAHLPLLKVIPFIKTMGPDQLATLRAHARWRELKRGHRLTLEGSAPGELMLVVRGALESSAETTRGKARYAMRGPGSWCGHESFFSGVPSPSNVTAKENTQLVAFDRASFDALFASRHELVLDLLEQITAALSLQFGVDQRALHAQLHAQGHHASISAAEIEGLSARPST